MTLQMTRAFRTFLILGLVGLVAVGAVCLWALQAESADFAFVPRAAQPTLGAVELQGEQDPPKGAGRVYFTTIGVRHATVWETWFGVDGGQLVPEHAVQPDGESDAERNRMDTLAMDGSQQAAEVVGLRALGYPVTVEPAGVTIIGIDRDAPIATSDAELGDIILKADDQPITTIASLRDRLKAIGVDRPVELGLHRDGKLLDVATTTLRSSQTGDAILGILPQQASIVDAPRTVTYAVDGVGGPSAGLAFALQIYSAGRNYVNLHGLRVAATGTLSMVGTVGPIGGIEEKAVGARRAGAEVFLVPEENADAARAAHVANLRIVPVGTFTDALRALAATP